jgi:hypothetical protein
VSHVRSRIPFKIVVVPATVLPREQCREPTWGICDNVAAQIGLDVPAVSTSPTRIAIRRSKKLVHALKAFHRAGLERCEEARSRPALGVHPDTARHRHL